MPSNANFSTTPNYDIAPDGTTTASLVTKITPTASVLHRTINPIGISPPFTYSLYFKQPTSITGSLTGGFAVRNVSISQTLIGSSFEFAVLENIVENKTAIIEWYIVSDKILAFVIQPGGKEIKVWQSSAKDFDNLFTADSQIFQLILNFETEIDFCNCDC
jgi:hypothetical protein